MKSFTIYKEYFDLITLLPKKEQGELLIAICYYMFLNTTPNLNENQMKIFRNLKRPLDKSKNKSKNSSNDTSNKNQIKNKIETNINQNKTKTKSNENQKQNTSDGNVNVNVFNNIKELINYIQDKLNYKLNNTPIEINTLNLWLENKVPKEVIKFGFDEARRKNKNDINYINGIVVKQFEEFKKKKQEEELPDWFNKKIEKDTEGLEEIDEMLKEFK